ncbi:MAG: hypothetical protein KBD60_00735 [Sterolibacterium sp.]|jgi:hypothetical protein|nr:hypothetical protein [Sterolibacterium sp.]
MQPGKTGKTFIATAIATTCLCGSPAVLAAGNPLNLKTTDDLTLGFSLSQYDYREPNQTLPTGGTPAVVVGDIKQSGVIIGLHGAKTWSLADGDFLRFDASFQGGDVDYTGSGTMTDRPLRFYDLRLVYGVDDELTNGVLSTYGGLGYRYLYNDMRGTVKLGNQTLSGYEREQQYLYLPVGLTYKTLLKGKRLSLTGELGLLIQGTHHSYNSTFSETFKQRSGFEGRLSAMLNQGNWEMGPYVHYWRVNDSDKNNVTVGNVRITSFEPKNTTLDIGVKIDRHF